MSQENVDRAREWIEAYNRRDFDAALGGLDPDVEWVLPAQQSADSGRGHEAVMAFFENIEETMEDLQLHPQEYVDGGDKVATRLRHSATGKGSGIEIDAELYHQVATFDEAGTIVRMEYFEDWEEALAATKGI